MVSLPIFLKLLSVFCLSINTKAGAVVSKNYNISTGSSLSPNSHNKSWSSPSGLFAFGFYERGSDSSFSVGIWMVHHPQNIIVWTANRDDAPVSSNATLRLKKTEAWLVLSTEHGISKNISSSNSSSSEASHAYMYENGNFVIYDNESSIIWQSFDHPTDTLLEGQNLTSGDQLVSCKSGSDYSSGRFKLVMQEDGNLVSYPANMSASAMDASWSTNTNGFNSAELRLVHNHTCTLFISYDGGVRWNQSSNHYTNTTMYRAKLDYDGIFRLYKHEILDRKNSGEPSEIWYSLQNQCEVRGACGINSYCQLAEESGNNNTHDCICYPGFAFINQSNKLLGCYQNFSEESCIGPRKISHKMTSLKNTSWFDQPYTVIHQEMDVEACNNSCIDDCNCWAALHSDHSCRKFNLPLRYGLTSNNISETALFKVVSDDVGTTNPESNNPVPDPGDNKGTILVLGLSLGSFAFLCILFAASSFILYKYRHHRYKKLLENSSLGLGEDFTLQSFSYSELEQATDGFSEEIGRGTFGAVYKGTLPEGNKAIAVKRLEKLAEEGIREFRAEMTSIGRTHHRNLVQLLGFCIEGSRKLLVYEFMSGGSVANRLFKDATPPTWRERARFVMDVARGIFYLHEECGVHIILCNLKPQNILLDDSLTAKISDFGFARLLVPNQTKTSMGVEETSIGYFAPEWQKNALISVKSDVYSFGVVLLEIICCRRNIEINVSTPDEITLSMWVYKCFKDGELDKLVDVEDIDKPTLERMVKVGLWCVQDDPSLRPLMKEAILMIEGTVVIPVPPSPELLVLP